MTPPEKTSAGGLIAAAVAMQVGYLVMWLPQAATTRIAAAVAAGVVGAGVMLWLIHRARRTASAPGDGLHYAIIIGAALLFRLTLLPLPPATSTDANRYLWEGLVQERGFNPYTTPPSSTALATLAAEYPSLWQGINHRDVASIYPPVAQLLFRAAAKVSGERLWFWKMILLGFDVLLCTSVWLLVRRDRAEPLRLALVAWCPLLVLETYEGAHLDIIGAALLVAAIVAVRSGRCTLSALLLAAGANVKYLWPMLAVPLLLREALARRRGFVFAAIFVSGFVVPWWPYRDGLPAAASTVRTFAEQWHFNDFTFELFRSLTGRGGRAALAVLAILVLLALMLARRPAGDLVRDVMLISATALLLGPVAFPWYFVWLAAGIPLGPPAWLAIPVLGTPLLHVVDWRFAAGGSWTPLPFWALPLHVAAGLLLVAAWRARLQRRRPAAAEPAP